MASWGGKRLWVGGEVRVGLRGGGFSCFVLGGGLLGQKGKRGAAGPGRSSPVQEERDGGIGLFCACACVGGCVCERAKEA
ncbi:hypothetical protein LY78DRAFT_267085 [Colletotrichum sublineola]|nr:hypothetical protein LY78DRAFT_267085 [Colletotrichum sublineola]